MKIGLEAPNGFPTHFAPQPHKYLEQTQPSISHSIQISNMLGGNNSLILMLIIKVQSLLLLALILSLLVEIPDSLKDTVLLPGIRASWYHLPIRPFLLLQACTQIFANLQE